MDAPVIILALALPALLGSLWLNLLIPRDTNARTTLVWGHGTLIGLVLIPQIMWLLDAMGLDKRDDNDIRLLPDGRPQTTFGF